MPEFEVSYAGVALCVPTDEMRVWVDANLSLFDLRDVQPTRVPPRALRGIAWTDPPDYPTPRLDQLFWPAGASRWAIGRFLATGTQLNQIYQTLLASTTTLRKSYPLVLQAESAKVTGKIEAQMFMLPPRPLCYQAPVIGATGSERDLYLLTFVDQRYFWHYFGVDGAIYPTWEQLVFACFQAVNVTVPNCGIFSGRYGSPSPDSALATFKEDAAFMLDAALWNTGRALAMDFDGTPRIQGLASSDPQFPTGLPQAAFDWAPWEQTRLAGGRLFMDPAGVQAPGLIVPERITVTFPKWLDNFGYYDPSAINQRWVKDSYAAVYEVNANALTINPPQTTGGRTKVIHDTARAHYVVLSGAANPLPTGEPTNKNELEQLALAIANDYTSALRSGIDAVFPGVVPWKPDGLNDGLILHQADTCWTRIQGRPFNSFATEMQHDFGVGPVCADSVGGAGGTCRRECFTDFYEARLAQGGGCEYRLRRGFWERQMLWCVGEWSSVYPPSF